MATTPPSWLDEAFKSAKEDFKKNLKNPALYDFSKINSPDDVIDEAIKIQKQQAKTRTLRGLKRIDPFINGLKEYAAVIEVFVQVKPDIMGIIWGSLKFILQASSAVISTFEKVVKVIGDLGMTLPSFRIYAQLFESNHEIRRVLCLFYADILDFYAVLLNFLSNRRLNVFLESLWPNIRSSIAKIQENIEYHKAIMTTNVTLEDVLRAHQFRKLALEEHARAQAFRESQTFNAIRNELNPHNYDVELMDILRRSSVVSGNWLDEEPGSKIWYDPADSTVRCLWLHGIPGCGKTFLVGNLIKKMQDSGQRVLFVFLSHDDQAAGDTVKVLHSLIFQLLEYDETLRPIVCETSQSNYRKLKSDYDFVLDLLCTILNSLGASYLILDGLDELNENSWKHLLSSVLQINEKCPETKLLISSREERMFIYAKLVLQMVKNEGTVEGIEMQIENIPDGLDQAYGRLLNSIKSKHTQVLRDVVRNILQWVACAQRPLREEEILQILAVEPGKSDFTKGRKEFRDIYKACGPIIEVQGGFIRFVHFSAKE
ncbi:nacht domain protein [Daldinia childiae]|uniref:nacht domain protein n=1 Tax=Daldinia childiae TaxID=326645 RepID=UPI001445E555|nr:nacht domain protein [Daldinia childiae]KAF3061219.1 nacht domain protein [Daldinia childiae]